MRLAEPFRLPLSILPQPDERTCGPTCLQAIYRYWGEDEALSTIVSRTSTLTHGGTLAVFLACDALKKKYRAMIYTYNLMVFDPTWFGRGVDIAERLDRQRAVKSDYRLEEATAGYLEFLQLGGDLRLMDLSRRLIRNMLVRGQPILTGLSSTFLYRVKREAGPDDTPDDINGLPSGHFVIIAGYDEEREKVLVLDPYEFNPYGGVHEYWIGIDRVIGAILLGIVTHGANLLIVRPRSRAKRLQGDESSCSEAPA